MIEENTAASKPWSLAIASVIASVVTLGLHVLYGHVHWNIKPLINDTRGVAGMLAKSQYAQKALIPPCPWLSRSGQAEPKLSVRVDGGALYVDWKTSGSTPRFYAVQVKTNGRWQAPTISAGFRKGVRLPANPAPDAIAVTAINAYGIASHPTVVGQR